MPCPRCEAHDLVAGNGRAAVGEADHAALGAGDEDLLAHARRLRREQVRGLGLAARQRSRDLRRHAVAEADVVQQRLQPRVAVFGEVAVEARGRQPVERGVEPFQRAVEHAVAEFDRVLVLQLLQLVADRGARLAGGDEFQPLRLGTADGAVMTSTRCPLASGAQRHQLRPRARRPRGCQHRYARRRRNRARWNCAAAT